MELVEKLQLKRRISEIHVNVFTRKWLKVFRYITVLAYNQYLEQSKSSASSSDIPITQSIASTQSLNGALGDAASTALEDTVTHTDALTSILNVLDQSLHSSQI